MTTAPKKASSDDIFDAFLLLTQYCGISTAIDELKNSEEVSHSSTLSTQVPYTAARTEATLLRDALKVKFLGLIPSAYSDKDGLSEDAIRVALVGFEILKYNFDDCLNMLRDLVSLVRSELSPNMIVMKVAGITRDLAKDGIIAITSNHSNDEVGEMLDEKPSPSELRQKLIVGIELLEKGQAILDADFDYIHKRLQAKAKVSEEYSDLLTMAPASTSVN